MSLDHHPLRRLRHCIETRQGKEVDGFTLVEMVLTIAVMSILLAIAIPSFTSIIASQRTKAVSTDLYSTLLKARSEATKRNANVTVSPKSGGWQNGWQILDPLNTSNVLEDREATGGVTISDAPTNVVYQSSGRIRGSSAPSFTLTSGGSTRCVSVDLSGRPITKAGTC